MENRRDSRTDEQREADNEREREFHSERREAGLPSVNYGATVTITVRDVTDEEAEQFRNLLLDAAYLAVQRIVADDVDARRDRGPHVGGGTFQVERNTYDVSDPAPEEER